MKNKKPMVSFLVMTLMMMAASLGMARDYGGENFSKREVDRAANDAAPTKADLTFCWQIVFSGGTDQIDLCESEDISFTLVIKSSVVSEEEFVSYNISRHGFPDGHRLSSLVEPAYSFQREPRFSDCWLC